jgi:hypothetical protein
MARRVFFSFHYERDVQRASIVRNHWITKDGAEDAGYVDKASWEKIEKQGDQAVRNWIEAQLKGTSVTAVLIGPETATRKWVLYELQKSFERQNGLLGVYLHNIKDWNGQIDSPGSANFGSLGKDTYGRDVPFSSVATTYDWVVNKGYENFATWVAEAAKRVGK